MRNKREVFTVGHSNHTLEYFLELLEHQNITCLIDVRTTPASSYNPQFNKPKLEVALSSKEITYMHFAEEFGARQENEEFLDNEGKVRFDVFQKSFLFQQGVERVDRGISKGYRISLMCSEGDPLECHRFSMILIYLEKNGIRVKHILKDKTVKTPM